MGETTTRKHATPPAEPGRITLHTIRPGFEKESLWTPGEAAKVAGVSVGAILAWRYRPLHGQLRYLPGHRVGPYQVEARSFKLFLQTGEPQGTRLRKATHRKPADSELFEVTHA